MPKDLKDRIGLFFQKKGWKQLKKSDLAAIALAGVLLLIIAMPTSPGSSKENKTEDRKTPESSQTISDSSSDTKNYACVLENRLKRILKQVDGVGNVDVMVTLSDSGESIVEKDKKEQTEQINETDSDGGTRTTTERETGETTVYVENGSETYPYVTREILPKVEGVLVVAEGGDNPKVISDISDTVMALFRVEAHKIKVVKMSSKEEK